MSTRAREIAELGQNLSVDASGNLEFDGTVTASEGSSGATANANADGIVIENNGKTGLSILTPNTSEGLIFFGDPDDDNIGRIAYNHSTNAMSLVTNNSTRFNIASNGDISFYEDTGTTAKLFWDASAESLGIGTSSPTTPAHITKGDLSGFVSRTAATLTLENSGDTELYLASSPTNTGQIRFGDTGGNFRGAISYDHSSDAFLHYTAGIERLRIDSSGRVGIGTTSPSSKLAISSGDLTLSSDFKLRWFNDNNYIVGSNSTDHIGFHTNDGSERMRIDSSGRVGIGTSAPTVNLDIRSASPVLRVSDTSATGAGPIIRLQREDNSIETGDRIGEIEFYSNDSSGTGAGPRALIGGYAKDSFQRVDLRFYTAEYNDATPNERMRIGNQGNITFYGDDGVTEGLTWDASEIKLGIGTSAPDHELSIEGSTDVQANLRHTNTSSYSMINFAEDTAIQKFLIGYGSTHASQANELSLKNGIGDITVHTNGTERMRIDNNNGNVGIGESSPTAKLHVKVDNGGENLEGVLIESTESGIATSPDIALYKNSPSPAGSDYLGAIWFYGNNSADEVTQYAGFGASSIDVTNGSEDAQLNFFIREAGGAIEEKMILTGAGRLFVNGDSTTIASDSTGTQLLYDGSSGYLAVSRSNSNPLGAPFYVNRTGGHDGVHMQLRLDGAAVGYIGATVGQAFIAGANSGIRFGINSAILPTDSDGGGSDNDKDLGALSVRFDDVYATNGTIQTSDRNEKQDIRDITEAEARVAQACKGLLKAYRWKDAVAEKGDDARIHFGIIAQDLQDAFTAEGLDAGDYAMFISNTWWETQTDVPAVEADEENGIEAKEAYTRTDTYETLEEAPEGATERTRLGVRYPELLAFIIAAI